MSRKMKTFVDKSDHSMRSGIKEKMRKQNKQKPNGKKRIM